MESSDVIAYKTRFNALYNLASDKQCFVNDDSCTNSIRAHAISEKRILRKLAENGKVISVEPTGLDWPIVIGFQPVGVGKVSTFSGMCGAHDNKIFQPIDDFSYELGNRHQEFLMMYRAFARAAWHSRTAVRYNDLLIQWAKERDTESLKKYSPVLQIWSSHIDSWVDDKRSGKKALDRITRNQEVLNQIRISSEYEANVTSYLLEFFDEYPIATSGIIDFDCDCHQQYGIADPPQISFTLFPQNGRTYAIFSALQPFAGCLNHMIEEYASRHGIYDDKVIVTHLLAQAHSDAFAVKPTYWESLDTDTRDDFIKLWRHYAKMPSWANIYGSKLSILMCR